MSKLAIETLRSYREPRGILRFVDQQFQVVLDPWQEEALLAFESRDPRMRRISLQACAGPGKSAVEAWAGWWFFSTQGRKNQHPKGACVSITGDNLRDNLWAEFQTWQQRSAFLSSQFTHTSSRIFANDHPNTWFLSARSWPQSANAEQQGKTLSGLHAPFVLILVDESGGIPTTVLRAGEQALSNCEFGKMMQAGNPISLDGMLHAAANELSSQWYVIRITGDPDNPRAWVHSPRFRARHISDDPELCGCPKCWAAQQIALYGRENPWVKSYILGEFPPHSINALLGTADVQDAMDRHVRADAYEWAQKRLGVDVARFGDDRSVIFPRQGLVAFKPRVMKGADSIEIASAVQHARVKWGGEPVTFVDDTFSWGNGVIDILNAAQVPTIRLDYADKALDPKYKNRRCEFWLAMAEWVKRGGVLPKIPGLVKELTAPTYTYIGGQFVLEEKAQIKARLGFSPDLADALGQTFALPEVVDDVERRIAAIKAEHNRATHGTNTGTAAHDFDPFN